MTMYLLALIRPWAASYVVVMSASTAPTTVSALTYAASAGVLTTTTGIKGGRDRSLFHKKYLWLLFEEVSFVYLL